MTAEEVKASDLRGRFHALKKKCRSASADLPADMLTIVVLAGQSLGLERHVTKWEHALIKVERKL